MVIPREHGAWGMLLVPLATGAVVAARGGNEQRRSHALHRGRDVAVLAAHSGRELAGHFGHQGANRTRSAALFCAESLAIGALALASVVALLWNGNVADLLADRRNRRSAFARQAGVKKLGRKGTHARAGDRRHRADLYSGRRLLRRDRPARPDRHRVLAGQLALCRRSNSLRAASDSLQPGCRLQGQAGVGTSLRRRPGALLAPSSQAMQDYCRPSRGWLLFRSYFVGHGGFGVDGSLWTSTNSGSANWRSPWLLACCSALPSWRQHLFHRSGATFCPGVKLSL